MHHGPRREPVGVLRGPRRPHARGHVREAPGDLAPGKNPFAGPRAPVHSRPRGAEARASPQTRMEPVLTALAGFVAESRPRPRSRARCASTPRWSWPTPSARSSAGARSRRSDGSTAAPTGQGGRRRCWGRAFRASSPGGRSWPTAWPARCWSWTREPVRARSSRDPRAAGRAGGGRAARPIGRSPCRRAGRGLRRGRAAGRRGAGPARMHMHGFTRRGRRRRRRPSALAGRGGHRPGARRSAGLTLGRPGARRSAAPPCGTPTRASPAPMAGSPSIWPSRVSRRSPTCSTEIFGRISGTGLNSAAILDRLGERFEISRNYFKRQACCRYNHPAVEAIEELLAATPVTRRRSLVDPRRGVGPRGHDERPGPRGLAGREVLDPVHARGPARPRELGRLRRQRLPGARAVGRARSRPRPASGGGRGPGAHRA